MHPDPVAIVHVHGSINRVDSCSECVRRKRIRDILPRRRPDSNRRVKPGTYTDSIKIRYSDYERAVKPLFADLALDYSEDWSTWS